MAREPGYNVPLRNRGLVKKGPDRAGRAYGSDNYGADPEMGMMGRGGPLYGTDPMPQMSQGNMMGMPLPNPTFLYWLSKIMEIMGRQQAPMMTPNPFTGYLGAPPMMGGGGGPGMVGLTG